MQTLKKYLKKKWVIVAIVLVVLIIIFLIVHRSSKSPTFETAFATTATVTSKVSVTGKVVPFQKSDLGFEKGGTVSSIPVSVGQHVKRGAVIATLNDNQTLASLQGAKASLSVAIAAYNDSQTDTQIGYSNAQKNAINAVRDAYVSANSAILNQTDSFFTGGTSVNPTLTLHTDSYSIERSVEIERVNVSQALDAWKKEIDSTTSETSAATLLGDARNYLGTIKQFMSDLSSIVLTLSHGSSGSSQATVDGYLATVNTANTSVNAALSSVTSAQNSLDTATPKGVASLQAKIDQAKADVANYEAQYAKSEVFAPFDGVVTRIDPQVGDIVTGGQTPFAMMGEQSFKVEVNIPEADIAKVSLGNKADITLDAYGESVPFPATVILIDPAETVVEGVPTYKVTLQFDQKDDRVRSGMTANIDIVTASVNDVVAVPFRSVVDKDDGSKVVRTVNADGKTYTEVPVTLGLKGSDGLVEVKSGISSSTEIVTFVK